MARKKKPKLRKPKEAPYTKGPARPSNLGPFPAKSVPVRFKKYVKHAGYMCKKCPFHTSKKDKAGRQGMRAHKRVHIRAGKARIRGILLAGVILGLIGLATALLLDAASFLPLVTALQQPILLALTGLSLLVFTISVTVLNRHSIRKEFYRALAALIPVISSSLALALVDAPVDPIHPLLPHVVLWAPLFAAFMVAIALPTLAKTWNTSGLNPRLRPEYEEMVQFKTMDDQLRVEDSITHLEYRAVTGRAFRSGPVIGKERALRELKEVKLLRVILMNRDSRQMNSKRGTRCHDNVDIMLKMANLEL